MNTVDLLHTIICVYFSHDPQNMNKSYYRYVGQQELHNLLQKNEMYFTNPSSWMTSQSDPYETYFENWLADKNNLLYILREIRLRINKMYQRWQFDNTTMINSVFSNYVAAIGLIQEPSYCYCVATTCSDRKMINEYHTKYGRNIIIKYVPDFYKKLAIYPYGDFVSPTMDYLYADVMPMRYEKSLDGFIDHVVKSGNRIGEIAKNVFDEGAFLKHSNYAYEHEVRMKLRIMSKECHVGYISNQIFNSFFAEKNEDKIIQIAVKAIEEMKLILNAAYDPVQDCILSDNGKEYFVLQLESGKVNSIIQCIYLHKGASDAEKENVNLMCAGKNITVREIDFSDVLLMQSGIL